MPNTLVKNSGAPTGQTDPEVGGGPSDGGIGKFPPVGSTCYASMNAAIDQLVSPSMVADITRSNSLIVVRTLDKYILNITGAACAGGYVSLQYTWSSPSGVGSDV